MTGSFGDGELTEALGAGGPIECAKASPAIASLCISPISLFPHCLFCDKPGFIVTYPPALSELLQSITVLEE